jgi:integrase
VAGKPLAPGTAGDIWTQRLTADGIKPERWKAGCRYRHANGSIQQLVRRGSSERAAKTSLRETLNELTGNAGTKLTGASRFRDAAAIYLERIQARRKGTTYDTKASYMRAWVLPGLGELRLRECTAARLNDYFESLADATTQRGTPLAPNSRRAIRKIVRGVMQIAILHEVIDRNPVDNIDDIEGGTLKKPTAYTAERVSLFFAECDADTIAVKSGLNLLLRFLFLTGARIGEAYALRWRDVNLDARPVTVVDPVAGEKTLPPHSLWINGNIVRVTGKGLLRHEGKTFASNRLIAPMPTLVYDMLFLHKPINADPDAPVFPCSTGTWRDPQNTQKRIAGLRNRIGFEEFTSHIGRKTLGTGMDAAGFTARQIADLLGKQSVRDTQETYMGRNLPNPAAAAAVDKLFGAAEG